MRNAVKYFTVFILIISTTCVRNSLTPKLRDVNFVLSNVTIECNVLDSHTHFPYTTSFFFELTNLTDKTLLFGSNNRQYPIIGEKIFGSLIMIHQKDTILLYSRMGLLKLEKQDTVFIVGELNDEKFFNQFSKSHFEEDINNYISESVFCFLLNKDDYPRTDNLEFLLPKKYIIPFSDKLTIYYTANGETLDSFPKK
jgi:hypothetical protein